MQNFTMVKFCIYHGLEGVIPISLEVVPPLSKTTNYSVNGGMMDTIGKSRIQKQAISGRERALCQLTVCFEFQSRSDRRTQKLCPANGIQK